MMPPRTARPPSSGQRRRRKSSATSDSDGRQPLGVSEVVAGRGPGRGAAPPGQHIRSRPMSRLSETLLPTLKDDPADAESASHRLMVRAGLVRQLGAGMWTYLPAGWRAHRRVEQMIREEMDADRRPGDADARAPAR